MFTLESDFRQVCFAVMSGCHAESCPWHKVEEVHGLLGSGCMRRGCGARLRGEAERMFTSLSSTSSWWTVEMVELLLLRSAPQRCTAEDQESAVQHWNFWLDIRGEKSQGRWKSTGAGSSGKWCPSTLLSDQNQTRPWATWSRGIHAEGKAGLDDL